MALQVKIRVSREKQAPAPNPDMLWILRRYRKLREEYPDRWIAVRDSTVVLSDDDLESLLKNLKNQFNTSTGFTVEFIGGRPRNLLLWFSIAPQRDCRYWERPPNPSKGNHKQSRKRRPFLVPSRHWGYLYPVVGRWLFEARYSEKSDERDNRRGIHGRRDTASVCSGPECPSFLRR